MDMQKGMVVKQDKSLMRYQFLELLLRLADQRYVQTGTTTSFHDGLDKVLAALTDIMDQSVANMDTFFAELHTEEVDAVYQRHFTTLDTVYRQFGGHSTKP